MKKYFELKTIADSVKDVSEKDRRVKVAISHMGSKDFDNDVIEHTAYTKTIKERGLSMLKELLIMIGEPIDKLSEEEALIILGLDFMINNNVQQLVEEN